MAPEAGFSWIVSERALALMLDGLRTPGTGSALPGRPLGIASFDPQLRSGH